MSMPFRVVFTRFTSEQFLSLTRSSVYAGRRSEATRAMRQIGQLLAHAPRTVGDPLYRLRAAKLEVRGISHGTFYVEYGVHDTEAIVVIRSVASFRGQVE